MCSYLIMLFLSSTARLVRVKISIDYYRFIVIKHLALKNELATNIDSIQTKKYFDNRACSFQINVVPRT